MQKISDNTTIVGCIRGGQECEHKSLVEDFMNLVLVQPTAGEYIKRPRTWWWTIIDVGHSFNQSRLMGFDM